MPTKTQALVIREKDAPFKLEDVELADPTDNEVLVEVVACGICHTDIALQTGAFPSPFPTVVGHEGSGIVKSVGKGVKRVQPGDKVLLSFASCGQCAYCDEGHPAGCETWGARNFGRLRDNEAQMTPGYKLSSGDGCHGACFGQSAFSKIALASESSCVKVPDSTDLKVLAPLGCGFQTGAGTIYNRFKPGPKDSVIIFGLGAVGMGALFMAKHLKVGQIMVVDLFDSRLELAKEFGATHTFNAKDEGAGLVDKVKKASSKGIGCDYAFDATGNVRALKSAWECIRNYGHVCSAGTPGPGVAPPVEIHDAVILSKIYSGLCEGDSDLTTFLPFLIELYQKGEFPVDRISQTYTVDKFDDALHAMHDGSVIKPIILL